MHAAVGLGCRATSMARRARARRPPFPFPADGHGWLGHDTRSVTTSSRPQPSALPHRRSKMLRHAPLLWRQPVFPLDAGSALPPALSVECVSGAETAACGPQLKYLPGDLLHRILVHRHLLTHIVHGGVQGPFTSGVYQPPQLPPWGTSTFPECACTPLGAMEEVQAPGHRESQSKRLLATLRSARLPDGGPSPIAIDAALTRP